MPYVPPAPGSIDVVLADGYVPPSPTALHFVVGGLSPVYGSGEVAPGPDVLSGAALVGVLSYGVVDEPTAVVESTGIVYVNVGVTTDTAGEVVATGTSTFAVGRILEGVAESVLAGTSEVFAPTGEGLITERAPRVSSVATSSVNVGTVVFSTYPHGEGAATTVAWGNLRPKRDRSTAHGYARDPVFVGSIYQSKDTVTGSASSTFRIGKIPAIFEIEGSATADMIAWGRTVQTAQLIGAGTSSVPVTIIGTVTQFHEQISGRAVAAPLVVGRVDQNRSTVTAHGRVVPVGVGRVLPQKDSVRGRRLIPLNWVALAYSSDAKLAPTVAALPSSTLFFNRDTPTPGTIESPSTPPLQFSR